MQSFYGLFRLTAEVCEPLVDAATVLTRYALMPNTALGKGLQEGAQ
jgi:hypothetical protein